MARQQTLDLFIEVRILAGQRDFAYLRSADVIPDCLERTPDVIGPLWPYRLTV